MKIHTDLLCKSAGHSQIEGLSVNPNFESFGGFIRIK